MFSAFAQNSWTGAHMTEENYTYLLHCADGSLYCGWTNHLEERVRNHNAGKGAKYTKSRRPVTLVYYECFATKQEAMRREWEIKQLTRKEKMALVETFSRV
jgi:putative endonuclease